MVWGYIGQVGWAGVVPSRAMGIIITLRAAAAINMVPCGATVWALWKILNLASSFISNMVWGCLEQIGQAAGDNVGARAVVTVLSVAGATGFVISGSSICFLWRTSVYVINLGVLAVGYDALSVVCLDHPVFYLCVNQVIEAKTVIYDISIPVGYYWGLIGRARLLVFYLPTEQVSKTVVL